MAPELGVYGEDLRRPKQKQIVLNIKTLENRVQNSDGQRKSERELRCEPMSFDECDDHLLVISTGIKNK